MILGALVLLCLLGGVAVALFAAHIVVFSDSASEGKAASFIGAIALVFWVWEPAFEVLGWVR